MLMSWDPLVSISDVLKLGSSTQINEKCLELQKSRKKEISKISKTKVCLAGFSPSFYWHMQVF